MVDTVRDLTSLQSLFADNASAEISAQDVRDLLVSAWNFSSEQTAGESTAAVTPTSFLYPPLDVRRYGAVGDGIVDCTTAFQDAYDSAAAGGGGRVYVPGGTWNLTAEIVVKENVALYGDGVGVTYIAADALGFDMFARSGSFGDQIDYASFENFTAVGNWLANQSEAVAERLFNVQGVERLLFNNVEALYSRTMSITAAFCNEVVVTNCRIRNSARDAINLTACRDCIVTNNHIVGCYDDAVAIHQTGAAGNPPIEGHVISGNTIEDSYGIKCLGAAKATISNNNLRRVKGYGIYVRGPEGVEGYSDSVSLAIIGNTITDIINGTFFGAGDVAAGILIGSSKVNYEPPVLGGVTPVYNLPDDVYYISNTAIAVNAGLYGITISGNTIFGYTLPEVANYSDWGYGTAFTSTGFTDPVMTGFHDDIDSIRLHFAILSMKISDNHFEAMRSGVVATSTLVAVDSIMVHGNTFRRFVNYGVALETAATIYGRAIITDNYFDADPYFEHANRTVAIDGTWDIAQFLPAALDSVKYIGFSCDGNHFRNMNRVEHANQTNVHYSNCVYYLEPNSATTLDSMNAANAGIRVCDGINEGVGNVVVWEESDPTSATYGQELGRSILANNALPADTRAYFIAGQFVKNTAFVESGSASDMYTIMGWTRLTTSNAHVLDTDWREMRCLTGN